MFKEFRKKILQYKQVAVFSHIRPDGDCIGSQVGLSVWLSENGVRAWAFNDDPVPHNIQWLTDLFPVTPPNAEILSQCEAFVLLDGNSIGRFGSLEQYQKRDPKPCYMIDHHPDPENGFELAISDEQASSTCELIYKLYMEHNPGQLVSGVTKALYAGLITDTGSLQFDSVTHETVQMAADLLRRGDFRPNEVAERVFSNRTVGQLQLLSRVLNTIQLFENNQIAIMYVTGEMMETTGTSGEDCEGFVNIPLTVSGIKAAVLLKDQMDNGVKMSLRSRSDVDVNVWARELDGGGHKKAAGAWHPGPLDSAIEDVVRIGAKQIKAIEDQQILS